jgi:hypothetical protein
MLPKVKQATIKPIITDAVAPGTLIHTDEYDIDARLPVWGYGHKTVCHASGKYARDDDEDGFCEVHVNTIEGFWSLHGPSCVRTVASRRTSCRSTSASSSSCITHAVAARLCSAPLSALSSHEPVHHPGSQHEPNLNCEPKAICSKRSFCS